MPPRRRYRRAQTAYAETGRLESGSARPLASLTGRPSRAYAVAACSFGMRVCLCVRACVRACMRDPCPPAPPLCRPPSPSPPCDAAGSVRRQNCVCSTTLESRTEGRMDGQSDKQTDGRTDGQTDRGLEGEGRSREGGEELVCAARGGAFVQTWTRTHAHTPLNSCAYRLFVCCICV